MMIFDEASAMADEMWEPKEHPMTDEEQAALDWLDEWEHSAMPDYRAAATTLKRMLAQPRLEEKPNLVVILETFDRDDFTRHEWDVLMEGIKDYHRGLYALTKPRTKTVEVWYVHYAGFVLRTSGRRWERLVTVHASEDEANRAAFDYEAEPSHYRHVRVTGPHAQDIPE